MKWNIKEHGESIEKLASKELDISIVKQYNEYWGKYVGHNNGEPISIEGIDESLNRQRLLLGQWCYTLLQNLLLLKSENRSPFNIKNGEYHKLTKSIRLYFEAVHLLYNSTEIIRHYNEYKLGEQIDITSFNSFRAYRNIIAHNIRPFLRIDGVVHFPKNYEVFDHLQENFVWPLDTKPDIEYHSIDDFKQYAFEQIKDLLFKLVENAIAIIENQMGGRSIGNADSNISAQSPPDSNSIAVSGSTAYNI